MQTESSILVGVTYFPPPIVLYIVFA